MGIGSKSDWICSPRSIWSNKDFVSSCSSRRHKSSRSVSFFFSLTKQIDYRQKDQMHQLLSLICIICRQHDEKLYIHFHKGFQNIVCKLCDARLPMFFAYSIQRWKHYWHHLGNCVFNQRQYIFIIPKKQCPFGDLNSKHTL